MCRRDAKMHIPTRRNDRVFCKRQGIEGTNRNVLILADQNPNSHGHARRRHRINILPKMDARISRPPSTSRETALLARLAHHVGSWSLSSFYTCFYWMRVEVGLASLHLPDLRFGVGAPFLPLPWTRIQAPTKIGLRTSGSARPGASTLHSLR